MECGGNYAKQALLKLIRDQGQCLHLSQLSKPGLVCVVIPPQLLMRKYGIAPNDFMDRMLLSYGLENIVDL